MKRLLTTIVLTVLLATAMPGLAQTPRRETAPPRKEIAVIAPVQVSVDEGRLEGGVYTNDFFGVSFSIPNGWVAQDAAAKKAIIEEGRRIAQEGASARKKVGLDSAMSRTAFLLSVSKYDPNTPAPEFNALLMCIAERVPSAVIKTETDYITASLRTIQGSGAKAELSKPIRIEKIGGATFAVADIKMMVSSGVAAQRYYATLRKGYAFSFVYSYVDEADLKAMDDMMKTLRFK